MDSEKHVWRVLWSPRCLSWIELTPVAMKKPRGQAACCTCTKPGSPYPNILGQIRLLCHLSLLLAFIICALILKPAVAWRLSGGCCLHGRCTWAGGSEAIIMMVYSTHPGPVHIIPRAHLLNTKIASRGITYSHPNIPISVIRACVLNGAHLAALSWRP